MTEVNSIIANNSIRWLFLKGNHIKYYLHGCRELPFYSRNKNDGIRFLVKHSQQNLKYISDSEFNFVVIVSVGQNHVRTIDYEYTVCNLFMHKHMKNFKLKQVLLHPSIGHTPCWHSIIGRYDYSTIVEHMHIVT